MRVNYLFAIAIVLVAITAYGQSPPAAKSKKQPEKNYGVSALHQKANYLLESAADEVRVLESLDSSVALAEEIVKLLARQKPEKCRQLLDAIFDKLMLAKSAGTPETESRLNSSIRRLISIAGTFDYKLAQSYIEKFSKENEAQKNKSQIGIPQNASLDLRLALAMQLLEKDPELAVSVAADTVRTAVTGGTLVFLGELRKKAPALAARFFTSALSGVRLRQGRDINELFLLYSYAFSLPRVPRVVSQQLVLHQLREYIALAKEVPVDAGVAREYLQASAEILMEQGRYSPPNLTTLTAGMTGDLYFIKLVAPYAKTYMPSLAERLARQQQFIASYLNPDQAAQLDASAGKFNALSNGEAIRSDSNYESVEHLANLATTATETGRKDQLFYRAAIVAVKEKKYEIALDLASRISVDSRDQAKEFISFSIAERTVADGDLESAQQLARRDGDVVRRAYILTLTAKAFIENKGEDRVRANELLIETLQLADKPEKREDAIWIRLGVAEVYALFDTIRAFETLRETVREANKLEKWTGDNRVRRMIVISGFAFAYELYNNNVSLPRLASLLAAKNFDEALVTVQGLKNDVPRLRSIIAICGMALSEKMKH